MKASLLSCLATTLAGTVSVDIQKQWSKDTINAGNNLFRALANEKGGNPVSELLTNGFFLYYATLYVGSDNQKIIPQVDTGSSDLWVMKSNNPYCDGDANCVGMEFDPTTSTTYKNLSIPWNIQYLDTTGAFGFLGQDTIRLGEATIENGYIAVADIANSTSDVFGVGLRGNEASVRYHRNGTVTGTNYPNYPASLKDQGYINTVAYSLFLNSVEAQDGIILFGGVDHAKYEGTLGLVPLVNVYSPFINNTIAFNIILNSISVVSSNTNCALVDGFSLPVLLDSGTSFAILPPTIVEAMASAYNYTYNPDIQFYEGDCNVLDFDAFELDFSGIKLSVNPETLLAPVNNPNNGTCVLAIEEGTDITSMILGDVFMRNFYIVYDLEHYQVALAQAKFTEDSDIEDIVSTIPGATSAPRYYDTAFVTDVATHVAKSCETHTTTASPLVFYTNDDYLQSSMIYGVSSATPTASLTTNSSSIPTSVASFITGHTSKVSRSATSNVTIGSSSVPTSNFDNSNVESATSTPTGTITSSSSNASTITATIPTPTTLTTVGQTFTVTGYTVLTITDCGCTEKYTSNSTTANKQDSSSTQISSQGSSQSTASPVYTTTTEVVSTLITTCPSPTTFSTNGKTFTITESTVLTITDCPCTLTHSQTVASETTSANATAVSTLNSEASTHISTSGASYPGADVSANIVSTPVASVSTLGASISAASSSASATAASSPSSSSSHAISSASTADASSAAPSVSPDEISSSSVALANKASKTGGVAMLILCGIAMFI